MRYFSMIVGLIFLMGVFSTGCDKGEQASEPGVKDAVKPQMEETAGTLEEVKEKSGQVVEEAVQDVKEAAETVKEEAVETMEEAKDKTKEVIETSKKEAGDSYQGAEKQVQDLLNQ